MDRFQAQMRNVTVNKVDDTIGRHFNLPGHHKIADMRSTYWILYMPIRNPGREHTSETP